MSFLSTCNPDYSVQFCAITAVYNLRFFFLFLSVVFFFNCFNCRAFFISTPLKKTGL